MGVFSAAVMALLGAPSLPAAAAPLQVTMSPALSPAFDPGITDYVFRYQAGVTEQVSVKLSPNEKASIDGQGFHNSDFTTTVNITPGQSFSFVVQHSPRESKTYHVRCLPTDFPAWTTERPGNPQSEYYIVTPDLNLTGAPFKNYVIIADNWGVPLWWYRSSGAPLDAKILPNGNIGWLNFLQNAEERRLDGSFVRQFVPPAPIGGTMDTHEFQLLSNGNYLFIANVSRGPVDLSPFGGSPIATVTDNVIEEVAPDGTLVSYWSAMDHIPVSEVDPHWWLQYLVFSSPADAYHLNSVEPTDTGYVVSLRHLNAVIRIDKASGNIVWKLGGSARSESLTFVGDAYGNFGGEHDARILPDGTLTLHDNGTLQGRAPRAVRYSIDPIARTATLVEQITDADAASSGLVGSARRLIDGSWVICWGGSPYVAEYGPDGSRVFRMSFQNSFFSYRASPLPYGVLNRAALRDGMNVQFPR